MNDSKSVEDVLRDFRKGYKTCAFKYGDWECSFVPLNADEENQILIQVESSSNFPNDTVKKMKLPLMKMKKLMLTAANKESVNMIPGFLDALSSTEIEVLYDQYIAGCHQVNSSFEDLTANQFNDYIEAVKKNPAKVSDLSIFQLRAIGQYFLAEILPTVKDAGGN